MSINNSPEADYRFEILDGSLCKIDPSTGRVVARHFPIGTSVVQVLPYARNIIVMENYREFPSGQSNVYCLTENFELVWSAELPSAYDVYANSIEATPTGLQCASWDCCDCTLYPQTGRILKKVFTK